MKTRKGFTLVETVACCLILAVVTVGVVAISQHIALLKTESRNKVQMTLHNLDCMERLRQMSYELGDGEELLNYYDKSVFSNNDFDTEVFLEMTELDTYRVYNVRMITKTVGYKQKLVNTYVFTNIGGPKPLEPEGASPAPSPVLGG